MSDPLSRLATAVADRYTVERELGAGGMATVYLAHDARHKRSVAVKVLRPELTASLGADRFLREIETAARLQHPHIVALYDSGEADGLLFYVMPYVDGRSLRQRIVHDGQLPIPDALRILRDVVDALTEAHAQGLVHRDIKPENVLIRGRHALVSDFGVAKAVSQAKTEGELTSVGVALGTPAYMAPEQAAADPNIDHRADIYAVGAMAYEMLTGRSPFAGLTPHQMLAAHITEPVVPVTDHRTAIPPALAELVMACLEKNPADRPQSAAEMLAVLEAMATSSGSVAVSSPVTTVRHMLRRPRNRVATVTALALILIAGWIARRPRTDAVLDTNRVAIAPFNVLGGPDLAIWRYCLVDVLSRSLDGAGPLRTVSPTLVIRRWSGRVDAQSAQALGQQTGARTVVFGTLVRAGADSVRLTATVLDVPGAAVLGDIELREQSDRMDRVADSLTVRVLRELGRTRAIGLVRSASLGSGSLPALKAFLQGEQFLRRSEWDSSLAYHQRAIVLDSGFTLAWSHAGMAAGWQHSAQDSLSRLYKLRAGAMNHGLAPRESLIVQAESLAAVVYEGPAQLGGRWWTYGKRLIGTLDDAVRRYPNDPELWYMTGDARYHAGALANLPPRASLEAFDRAIALDSAFTPSYIHAIPLALDFSGERDGRRYAAAFLKAGAMGTYARSTDLVVRLTDPSTREQAIEYLADSADTDLFQTVSLAVGRWTDSAETAVLLVRRRVDTEKKARKTSSFSVFTLPFVLGGRGHVKEAATLTTFPSLLAQYVLVGGIPSDSARRMARSWVARLGDGILPAMPLLAGARDTTALNSAIQRIDSARSRPLGPNIPPIARDFLGYVAASARAYLALAQGDTVEALRRFDARPDSACFGGCPIDDLVYVQLLAARGRSTEAAALLERQLIGFSPGLTPVEVLRALERGRVNERLGNRERAVEGYALVVRAWRNADPELQPYVTEARAALTRLNPELKKPAS